VSAANPYERANRMAKVLAMLALIPCEADAAANGRVADLLAQAPQWWRNEVAKRANVTPPSADTWSELVAAVRARRGAKDGPLARGGVERSQEANDNNNDERTRS
jgi:hypothetical protein